MHYVLIQKFSSGGAGDGAEVVLASGTLTDIAVAVDALQDAAVVAEQQDRYADAVCQKCRNTRKVPVNGENRMEDCYGENRMEDCYGKPRMEDCWDCKPRQAAADAIMEPVFGVSDVREAATAYFKKLNRVLDAATVEEMQKNLNSLKPTGPPERHNEQRARALDALADAFNAGIVTEADLTRALKNEPVPAAALDAAGDDDDVVAHIATDAARQSEAPTDDLTDAALDYGCDEMQKRKG